MSFPKYPEYKGSGVEWLGEVPRHWEIARFSRIVLGLKDGTHGTFARTSDGKLLLSAKNVLNGRLKIEESDSMISEEDHASIVSNGFPKKGDLLLTIVGTIGRCCIYDLDSPLAFQRSVCFIRLREEFISPFFFYLLQTKFFQDQLLNKTKLAAQGGVYMGDVAACCVLFPRHKDEQSAIASFLDRETAKIDALVTEQEKLIELLKEKRQAVISHAVIKGLDPSVPMKDSGVEWLGEVPEHWDVKRLKFVAHVQGGVAKGRDLGDADTIEVPFLRVANVQDGYLDLDDIATIQIAVHELPRYSLQPGDVLMNEGGDFDKLGRGHIWRGEIETCIHQNHVFAVRPIEIEPEWLNLLTSAAYGRFYFMSRSKQSTNLASISSTNISEFPLICPPLPERMEITKHVQKEIVQIDALLNESRSSIDLLKERRSALISAAVTGKIDVRGLANATQ